jgi:hypothetical protein
MDMKFAKLVFTRDLFDGKTLNYYQGKPTYDIEDLKYALIISYHPAITNRFNEIRKSVNSYPFKYPELKDLGEFYAFERRLKEAVKSVVEKKSNKLVKDLKLSENWRTPIFIKICTNILPIPYPIYKFSFAGPNLRVLDVKSGVKKTPLKNLRDLTRPSALRSAFEDFRRLEDATKYPYIAIKEKLTKKGPLIDYINRIFDTAIKPATSLLPFHKHKKADMDKFMLSIWLFDLLRNQGRKPKEVNREIEKADPDQNLFGKYDMTSIGISKLADEARVKLGEVYPL